MALLSKSEILYLQGQKQVSKSYEYKLKSVIKKKFSNLIEKELPLLSNLLPNLDLTKSSKIPHNNKNTYSLTETSKLRNHQSITSIQPSSYNNSNIFNNNIRKQENNTNSPAQIRTGVKGSKGLYAWPLHSALVILPGFRAFLYCKYGRY